MFKKLIAKLYRRYCEPDILSMTLLQLGHFNDPVKLDELSDDKREHYYDSAVSLLENKALIYAFDTVAANIKDAVWHKSSTDQILWDRFTLNGAYLVREVIQQLATMKPDKAEVFDKHAIL